MLLWNNNSYRRVGTMHWVIIPCMLAMIMAFSKLTPKCGELQLSAHNRCHLAPQTESLEIAPLYSFDSLRSPFMPPLNRQDSRPSIYSRWSDSNSLLVYGPTINLHAASKPLMRLMHHRQALGIIRKNLGSPLTTTILETYSSYFPYVHS
jgi:hypothetical protein